MRSWAKSSSHLLLVPSLVPLPPLLVVSLVVLAIHVAYACPAPMSSSYSQAVPPRPPVDLTDDVRITAEARTDRDPASSRLILNQYVRGPQVGKGVHGEVFLCWDISQDMAERVSPIGPCSPFTRSSIPPRLSPYLSSCLTVPRR